MRLGLVMEVGLVIRLGLVMKVGLVIRLGLVPNADVYRECFWKRSHSFEFPHAKRFWSNKDSRSSM